MFRYLLKSWHESSDEIKLIHIVMFVVLPLLTLGLLPIIMLIVLYANFIGQKIIDALVQREIEKELAIYRSSWEE